MTVTDIPEIVQLTTFVPLSVDKKYPELNVSLLEQFFKWAEHSSGVEGNPAWYQGTWAQQWMTIGFDPEEVQAGNFPENFCGTSFCAAGYVLHVTGNLTPIEGGVIPFEPKAQIVNEAGEVYPVTCPGFTPAGAWVLGMTMPEADAFFGASNTLPVLKQMALIMAERRGVEINV